MSDIFPNFRGKKIKNFLKDKMKLNDGFARNVTVSESGKLKRMNLECITVSFNHG